MKAFEYIKPSSISEAISILNEHDEAFLLAGGTDLITGIKNSLLTPQYIIDLKRIPNLDSFECKNGWKFGSLTTVRDIEISESIRKKMPYMSQAAACLASVQIRNRATLGGNLCNASPAADMATMMLAMDSRVKIVSVENEKIIKLDEFFQGPKKTVLNRGDLLTEIMVPKEMENFRGIYMKYGTRKAMDIGIVNAAVLLDADFKRGLCKKICISLGAVAPTPIRASKAEDMLNGTTLTPDLIENAAELASSETNPISDFRASADYRRNLVRTLVARGINGILESNKTP